MSVRDRKIFYVERSCNGLHIVSKYAFYPINNIDIPKIRNVIKKIHNDINIDISSSVRDLPIRRTPSGYTDRKKENCKKRLVYAIESEKFLSMSLTEIDLLASKLQFKNRNELKKYLKQYTTPTRIYYIGEFDYTREIKERLTKERK